MNVRSVRRVHEGRVIRVRVDEVDARRGGTRPFEVVEHGGGVVIVAQPSPVEIVLVRQHRHAVGEDLWEAPAGMLEPNEAPAAAAARELREETGYRATAELVPLFTTWATPGFCTERWHFYHADGVSAGAAEPDEDEEIESRIWSVEEAWSLVVADRLRDGKTQIALAWARMRRPGDGARG